jgi:uncharacterized cofD-like protein
LVTTSELGPSVADFAPSEPRLARELPHFASLPRNIVYIGGGTGASTVGEGLTAEPLTGEGVTAIVTTFDDGGGTGELRRVYTELPGVGDIRQNMRSQSRLSAKALAILEGKFGEGDLSELLNIKGQNPGNLLIASSLLSEFKAGGNFSSALGIVAEIYQTKGSVVPSSNDIRTLRFELPNGKVIEGEHAAEQSKIPSFKGTNIRFNQDDTNISEEAEAKIKGAEMVVLAPGDLYTSIGPNLVLRGMKEALMEANVVVMISNLMNRKRHTRGFTTLDYAQEYTRLIGAPVIQRVIYNTEPLDEVALAEQALEGSHPVRPNVRGLKRAGYTVRGFNLLSTQLVGIDSEDLLKDDRTKIRHDPAKIAGALFDVYLNNGFGRR